MKRLFSPPWSGSCVSHHFRESSVQMYPQWKSHSSLYAYSTSAALLISHQVSLFGNSFFSPQHIHFTPTTPQKKKKSWCREFVQLVCSASMPATGLAWGFMFFSTPSVCPILVNLRSPEFFSNLVHTSIWTHVWTIQKFAVTVTKLVILILGAQQTELIVLILCPAWLKKITNH